MRKTLIICIVFFLLGFSVPKVDAADDITNHYFEKEMRYLISKGILEGYGSGVYQPDKPVTRAEFAKLIVKALNLESAQSAEFSVAEAGEQLYTDVHAGEWYYTAVESAAKAGIVTGYPDGTFKPNTLISRQEMAVMAFRAVELKGIVSSPANVTFADSNAIHPDYLDAIKRLVNLGIMKGNGDNTFAPLANTTRGQTAAVITRILTLLEPPVQYDYKIVEFNEDRTIREIKSFPDFTSAKNSVLNNQAVMKGNSFVYIKSGLTVSNKFTVIYNDTNFVDPGRTYVSSGTELQYIDAGADWVKISIGNVEGYVKPDNVNLIPTALITGRSYYERNGDDLVFTIYNPITSKNTASIIVGKAPSFMVAGQKYFSWDGGIFYNSAGVEVGRAYQYFNYLPARAVSNYTAEELNRFIDANLAERESYYRSNPTLYARYKDASTISKIKGLGNYIKEAESKYKINALLILAMAMHESDFGMSRYAQERNNLFGLNAVDSNPDEADFFTTPNEAIDGLATYYLNLNYIPPKGSYANGAVPGNKAIGINVKYASDPYWGQKVAGHMYRADKFLGQKDINQNRIGLTNESGLNARHEPIVSEETLQFTYQKAGMPVAILGSYKQSNGSIWYKVISDHNDYKEAYIRSDFIDDINLAK